MKRGLFGIFLLTILIINLSFVSADNETDSDEFSLDRGFRWLSEEMYSSNWGTDIDSLSWAILALRNADYDVSGGIDKLRQLEGSDNWDNEVYDTSLAILALYKSGEDVDAEVEWLIDRQKEALKSGEWLIQFLVESGDETDCVVRYEGDSFEFTVNDTKIVSPSDCNVGEYWVDFEECIKEDDADMVETFSVNCLDSVDASLLFKSGSNYYIVDQSKPLKIENACFHDENVGCRCSVTQYASWVLQERGERPLTLPYLRSNCNDKVIDNIFLYMLTSNSLYANYLIEERSVDGGWDNDYEKTAMAVIALRDSPSRVASSLDWLEFYQDPDGSWDGDIRTTAKVLYAMTSEAYTSSVTNETSPLCGNGIIDEGEECELTSDCSAADVECIGCKCVSAVGCISDIDCDSGEKCILGECVVRTECSDNSDCSSGYECIGGECKRVYGLDSGCTSDDDCFDDEVCEDGVCVAKSSGWVTWLVVILIVVVAGVGGYFGYKQFFRKKGKGSGYKPKFDSGKPSYPAARQNLPVARRSSVVPSRGTTKDRLESQLDQSLKKARDLLGKK